MTIDEKKIKALVKSQLKEIQASTEEVVVKTHADYEFSAKELLNVKEQMKEADERKDLIVKPAKEIIKQANELYAPVTTYLDKREVLIKAELSRYLVECEDKRIAQLRQAQKVGKVNRTKGVEMIAMAESLSPPKVKGIAVTATMDMDIFDESLIPDTFFKTVKVLNTDALEAALKEGEDIPGVIVKARVGIRATPSHREK